MQQAIIADITKDIRWAKGEYDVYVIVDGEPIYLGSTRSRIEADSRANTYAYDYLTDTHTYESAAGLLMPTIDQQLCAIWNLDPATKPGGEGTVTERMARIWS